MASMPDIYDHWQRSEIVYWLRSLARATYAPSSCWLLLDQIPPTPTPILPAAVPTRMLLTHIFGERPSREERYALLTAIAHACAEHWLEAPIAPPGIMVDDAYERMTYYWPPFVIAPVQKLAEIVQLDKKIYSALISEREPQIISAVPSYATSEISATHARFRRNRMAARRIGPFDTSLDDMPRHIDSGSLVGRVVITTIALAPTASPDVATNPGTDVLGRTGACSLPDPPSGSWWPADHPLVRHAPAIFRVRAQDGWVHLSLAPLASVVSMHPEVFAEYRGPLPSLPRSSIYADWSRVEPRWYAPTTRDIHYLHCTRRDDIDLRRATDALFTVLWRHFARWPLDHAEVERIVDGLGPGPADAVWSALARRHAAVVLGAAARRPIVPATRRLRAP